MVCECAALVRSETQRATGIEGVAPVATHWFPGRRPYHRLPRHGTAGAGESCVSTTRTPCCLTLILQSYNSNFAVRCFELKTALFYKCLHNVKLCSVPNAIVDISSLITHTQPGCCNNTLIILNLGKPNTPELVYR